MVHMVCTWITSNVNIWLRCGESMVSSMVDVYHGGFRPPLNSPPSLRFLARPCQALGSDSALGKLSFSKFISRRLSKRLPNQKAGK